MGSIKIERGLALLIALASAYIIVMLALAVIKEQQPPCDRSGDYSILSIKVEQAKNFELLTGPYSRNKFDHPGPISFYLYALGEKVLGAEVGPYASYALTQLVINLLLLAAALLLFAKEAGFGPASLMLVLALLLFPNSKPSVLTDIWGPSTLLVPMLSMVVAAVSISRGNIKALLLLSISAVMLISNHIGTALVVVILSIVSIYLCLRERRNHGEDLAASDIRWIGFSVAIAAVGAALPTYEALTAERWGNFGRIVRFMMHSSFSFSPIEALSYLAQFYGPSRLGGVFLLLIALVLVYLAVTNSYFTRFRTFVVLGILCSIVSVMKVRGKLYPFIFWHQIAFAVLLFTAALTTLSFVIARKLGISGKEGMNTAILASLLLTLSFRQHAVEGCASHGFYSDIISDLEVSPQHLYTIESTANWSYQGGLVLELVRAGVPVCVENKWRFMFGDGLTCRDPRFAAFANNRITIELQRADSEPNSLGEKRPDSGLKVFLKE